MFQPNLYSIDINSHVFQFPSATHEIKDLTGTKAPIGENVTIHGYLGERVDLSKKLSFVPLISKDLKYSIQVMSISRPNVNDEHPHGVHEDLKTMEAHNPVAIVGVVKAREPGKSTSTEITRIQDVEIELQELHSLNEFPKDIIFKDETRFPPSARHLQIRSDKGIRDALAFRAKMASVCRNELELQGFMEVETPLLFKSTPEGAREFLVPSRQKGMAYALPQSPQQYKQILMASGIPKYYQLARCFRDEDLRADRQPEFTQLDLEMSFVTGEDVMRCIEVLIRRLWKEMLGVHTLPDPFPFITYDEAMAKYGSDKPYIQIGMEISRIDDFIPQDLVTRLTSLSNPIIETFKLNLSDSPRTTLEFITNFLDSPEGQPYLSNPDGAPGVFIFDATKPLQGLHPFGFEAAERMESNYDLSHGDLIIVQARRNVAFSGGSTPLGNLRLSLHRAALSQSLIPKPKGYEFHWVTDFPLFSPIPLEKEKDADPGQGGKAGLRATHHPFTAPKSIEDVNLLISTSTSSTHDSQENTPTHQSQQEQYLKIKADHYDLILNGTELGGGSRRIHSSVIQRYIFESILKMPPEKIHHFDHLLEVLRAGCPPHAGIALGFDRLTACMLGRETVRDVIAFPKSGRGEDALVKSPGLVGGVEWGGYGLVVKE
ncbi:MAG: hypothetical protein M1823_002750 [Watsoniomyces obsoletus]|nr:MAG: hypothetical protein M1823_002750 [Watsoniomyces obsoletus]